MSKKSNDEVKEPEATQNETPETETPENTEMEQDLVENSDGSFSPLHEPRTDRDYAAGLTNPSATPPSGNIPEPDFTAKNDFQPSSEPEIAEPEEIKSKTESQPPPASKPDKEKYEEPEPINPPMRQQTKKEQLDEATVAAEAVIDVYLEYKPKLFRFIGKVPKKKIDKMVLEGKIDLDLKGQWSAEEHDVCTLREKLAQMNGVLEEAFQSEPDFKEKVLPPLTRIFMKRGIGMTDEQFLMMEFGKDLLKSGIELVEIKSIMRSWLDAAADLKMQKELWLREWQANQDALHAQQNPPQNAQTPPPPVTNATPEPSTAPDDIKTETQPPKVTEPPAEFEEVYTKTQPDGNLTKQPAEHIDEGDTRIIS